MTISHSNPQSFSIDSVGCATGICSNLAKAQGHERSKYSKDLAGSKTPYLSYLTLLQKLNRFRGHLAMPRFEPVLSVCQAVSDSSEVSARVDCMAQRKRSRLPPGRLGFKSLRFVKFVNDVNIIRSQNTSIRTWRSYLLDVSSISGGIKKLLSAPILSLFQWCNGNRCLQNEFATHVR